MKRLYSHATSDRNDNGSVLEEDAVTVSFDKDLDIEIEVYEFAYGRQATARHFMSRKDALEMAQAILAVCAEAQKHA